MMGIVDLLEERQVRFETIEHESANTASQLADCSDIHGAEVVKSVLARIDDGFVIALLPMNRCVDFDALATLLGSRSATLATHAEVETMFPNVEPGVVPPFGAPYGIRTVVDIHLAACRFLVFCGPTHREAIRMTYEEYELFEAPFMGLISSGSDARYGRN